MVRFLLEYQSLLQEVVVLLQVQEVLRWPHSAVLAVALWVVVVVEVRRQLRHWAVQVAVVAVALLWELVVVQCRCHQHKMLRLRPLEARAATLLVAVEVQLRLHRWAVRAVVV